MSLIVDDESSSESEASAVISARERTDTGDTANTVDTVASCDSADMSMDDFRQLLSNQPRLMVSL